VERGSEGREEGGVEDRRRAGKKCGGKRSIE